MRLSCRWERSHKRLRDPVGPRRYTACRNAYRDLTTRAIDGMKRVPGADLHSPALEPEARVDRDAPARPRPTGGGCPPAGAVVSAPRRPSEVTTTTCSAVMCGTTRQSRWGRFTALGTERSRRVAEHAVAACELSVQERFRTRTGFLRRAFDLLLRNFFDSSARSLLSGTWEPPTVPLESATGSAPIREDGESTPTGSSLPLRRKGLDACATSPHRYCGDDVLLSVAATAVTG